MALRGTLTHRKTRRLAKLLGISQAYALGVLESLWHVTAEQQTDGGIGRMKDADIAEEMFWDGDPTYLITSLIESEWLEVSDSCRLYVHDWHEHADDSIHSKLIQWTRLFAARAHDAHGAPPRLRKLSTEARERVIHRYEERYGQKIRQIMISVRTNAEIAHGAPDAHIQSQSPEPESRARVHTDKQTGSLQVEQTAAPETPKPVRPSRTPPVEIPRKPMSQPPRPPGNQTLTKQNLAWMTNLLHSYMRTPPTGTGPPIAVTEPPQGVVLKCLEIVTGVDQSRVERFLSDRNRSGQRRGAPGGPKDYPWFITVLQAQFQRQAAGVGA